MLQQRAAPLRHGSERQRAVAAGGGSGSGSTQTAVCLPVLNRPFRLPTLLRSDLSTKAEAPQPRSIPSAGSRHNLSSYVGRRAGDHSGCPPQLCGQPLLADELAGGCLIAGDAYAAPGLLLVLALLLLPLLQHEGGGLAAQRRWAQPQQLRLCSDFTLPPSIQLHCAVRARSSLLQCPAALPELA